MRRLFYRGILGEEIRICGADAHHLMHVLRAKPGDEMVVVDDVNQVARMEMIHFAEDAVTMRMKERLSLEAESPLEITLVQCLLKADKMDFVVQKAAELGVGRVLPLLSRNCVVRYDRKKREERQERWQRIAHEAAKQCGRTALMEVGPIQEISAFFPRIMDREEGKILFCYENETNNSIKEHLRGLMGNRVMLIIGPEGGFTQEEAERIETCGGISVTLGPRILRAETAAVAALAVVQYEKGDLG